MLISRSKLNVKDNSGIQIAQCIQAQRSKKSLKPCQIGDFLKASVKKGSSKLKLLKLKAPTSEKSLKNIVLFQTKKTLRRLDGSAIRFNSNSGIIVNERKLPLFKRVTGVVPLELKKSCSSVLNLAKNII
uniref:Ribosomal protein L14 n=1 Tax=Gloeotilopsis planctonica TaxID=34157 RepID=A0A1B2RYZ1_9CHLO|nr:ribosomal protein L14 [Gloeotilopsis planctonica]